MGPQYKKQFDVSPNDTLEQIRLKTNFYQLFTQRNYSLETDGGVTIERDKLATTYFRDSGLRNGSNIFMRPPQRDQQRSTVEVEDDQEEGEEGGFFGEGGEDEMNEMMGEGGEDEIEEGAEAE